MRELRKYLTGYLVDDWKEFPPPPYKGKGWRITLSKPTKEKTGQGICGFKTRRVIIKATSFEIAQNALDLINSAICLTLGSTQPFGELEVVRPDDDKESNELFEDSFPHPDFGRRIGMRRIPCACIIAAKASHRRSYKYALIKLKFASDLHSVHWVDIDPSLATEHLGVSPYSLDHVRLAFSIIASYGAIEELGLEIRATSKKPSISNGKWNPIVKQDLERRLKRAHINLEETVPWALRGKPTKIEKAKELPSKGKCSWARGPYIRDCELEVIDAIRIASFLRSKVAAHKMGDIVSSLSSYDTENVRHLARRLLLERLGFWR